MEDQTTYSIKQQAFGKFTEYRLVNNQNGSYVAVVPEYGANLNQAAIFANNEVHEILLGPENSEKLVSENPSCYKGSKLLPFPNRINHGDYVYNNKSYHLDTNETARDCSLHGLVFDKPFTVESTSADNESAKLVTTYEYDGSNEGYPFKYSVRFTFELKAHGFTCTTLLKNTDDKDLPIGDGIHPYFKTGSLIDGWVFTLPRCQILEVDDRLIPTKKIEPFAEYETAKPFGDRKFDSCFVVDALHAKDGLAIIDIQDKEKGLRLSIWQEAGPKKYNYIQIYTPPDRKSMAIEPMSCAPNAFNNELGLIILTPDSTVEFSWGANLTTLSQ